MVSNLRPAITIEFYGCNVKHVGTVKFTCMQYCWRLLLSNFRRIFPWICTPIGPYSHNTVCEQSNLIWWRRSWTIWYLRHIYVIIYYITQILRNMRLLRIIFHRFWKLYIRHTRETSVGPFDRNASKNKVCVHLKSLQLLSLLCAKDISMYLCSI